MRFSCSIAMVLAACGGGIDGVGGGPDLAPDAGVAVPDSTVVNTTACKRVDVVISVDNSGSMGEEKTALRDIAFPGFATALKNVAGGLQDFRVGVIDACPEPSAFHTSGAGGACSFSSGTSWMDSSSAKLVDEFKCVGDIQTTSCTSGGVEQPATALIAALQQAGQVTSMVNKGFLRDDALLVVVAITDEDEQPTPDLSPQEIYNRLTAIKGGDVSKIVFLGIGGASDCAGAYGTARTATKLRAVTDLFTANQRGVFWDLCQGNLEQGLTQALATIETACNDFGPLL